MPLADLFRRHGLTNEPQPERRGLASLMRRYGLEDEEEEATRHVIPGALAHERIEAATGMELDESRTPGDALRRVAAGTLSSLSSYADLEETALRAALPAGLESRAVDLLLGTKRRALETLSGVPPGGDVDEAARRRFINAGSGTDPIEEALADTAGHALGILGDATGLVPLGRVQRLARPAQEAAEAAGRGVARVAARTATEAASAGQHVAAPAAAGAGRAAGSLDVVRPPEAPFQYHLGAVALDDEGKQLFRETVAEHLDSIQVQRREGQGDWQRLAEPDRLASTLGITTDDLLATPAGQAFNYEEMGLSAAAIRNLGEKIREQAASIAAGDDSTIARAGLAKLRADYAGMARVWLGAGAEAGRALNVRKALVGAMGADDATRLKILKRHANDVSDEQIQAIAEIDPEKPEQLYGFLRDMEKPRAREFVHEFFVANLLSSPRPHLVNVVSNSVGLLANEMIRPATALLAKDRTIREVLPAWQAIGHGFSEGMARGLQIMLKGANFDEAGALIAQRSAFDRSSNPFVRKLAPVVNWPLRSLSAMDSVFKGIAFSAEMHAEAARRAVKKGLDGDELAAEIARLVSSRDPAIIEKAAENARFSTFTDKPSLAAQLIGKGVSHFWPLRFVVPFVNVADRLFARGFEYTPYGFLKAGTKAGKERAEDLSVRAGLGSATMLAFTGLAMSGRLTGAAPKDPRKREAFYAEGKQPYSVRVGDWWVPFSGIEPFATPMMLVAGWHDGWVNSGEVPTEQKILAGLASSARSQLDKAYFQGLLDLLVDIESPGATPDRLKSSLVRQAAALAPASGLTRAVATAGDPTLRKPDTLAERLMLQTPGLQDNVPPRLDAFGEPIERVTAGDNPWKTTVARAMATTGHAALAPLAASLAAPAGTPLAASRANDDDPVLLAFSEAGMHPSVAVKVIRGEALSESEQDEVKRIAGPLAKERIERVVRSPDFWLLSKEQKARRLRAILDAARQRGRAQLLARTRSISQH